MLLLLPLLACRKIEPAPADLDGLLHWFWAEYEPAEDEALLEGITNAQAIVDVQALAEEFEDGTLTDLSVEEAALVGVTDRDPALAVGLYLLNVFDCSMDQLEPVLWEPDQASLYEGVYESYERTFTSSQEDFASGAVDTLSWEVVYEAKLLGSAYVAETVGGLRRLPDGALLQRTYLPEPAVYDSDGKSFDQDYQIEIYIEQPEGVMLHLYGLWRQADYGIGDLENEDLQRILLNNLAKWDDSTEAACGS